MTHHLIDFTIGDWSNDGHELSNTYYVQSSLPLDDLRELHFKAPDVLGVDIGELCSQADNPYLTDAQEAALEQAGVLPHPDLPAAGMSWDEDDVFTLWLACLVHIGAQTGQPVTLTHMTPHRAAYAGLCAMLAAEAAAHGLDPDVVPVLGAALVARIQAPDSPITLEPTRVPTLHFYGADKKGRHLAVPGYGAFLT